MVVGFGTGLTFPLYLNSVQSALTLEEIFLYGAVAVVVGIVVSVFLDDVPILREHPVPAGEPAPAFGG